MEKKIISLGIILIFILSLTSCKTVIADKNGNSLRLTYEDVEKEGRSGLFVLNNDKTFSPAPPIVPGFEGSTDSSNPSRYLWYTDAKNDFTSLIPIVTKDTPLVIIYDQTNDIPDEWYLEKYACRGYTVGTHIFLGEDKTMFVSAKDFLDGTTAAAAFGSSEAKASEYPITSISGASSDLPINNVDPNMKILLGLEKDKVYTIKFYRGTKVEELELTADTVIFQSSRYISLSTPYKKTEHGYFLVNLPYNLAPGYYYLSDLGFFKYEG